MKKLLIALLTLGISVALVGCGNGDSTSGSDFNKQDVTFAQDMIPHHRQAVEMARLAETRASSPDVKALATTIEGAQGPEIATMEGWLKSWDKPIPDVGMSGMEHGSGGDSMAGMMSDADMKSLGASSGAEFDTMFLTMMIEHHQGAITMADKQVAKGSDTDAITLARTIATAQTAEIATMKGLLAK